MIGSRGKTEGYRRIVYEPEAEIVRRIFRLFVGDEGGRPHSTRQIAQLLTAEGVAPPGARRQNRALRQATSRGYTSLVGYRRLKKGILSNPIYIGRPEWNRSKWLRDPDTKGETYRPKPAAEWVEVEVPDLRIVPQDLWDRAQARLRMYDIPGRTAGRRNVGNYLMSGFVRCGECGGADIKTSHSYRCGTHRNRGHRVCSNGRSVAASKLQRVVIDALREKLYTQVNLKAVVAEVRDQLLARAKREAQERLGSPRERARELREIQQEIENIKAAVRLGKATETLLGMLEDAERRKEALQRGEEAPAERDVQGGSNVCWLSFPSGSRRTSKTWRICSRTVGLRVASESWPAWERS